jgi:hypothetical protein
MPRSLTAVLAASCLLRESAQRARRCGIHVILALPASPFVLASAAGDAAAQSPPPPSPPSVSLSAPSSLTDPEGTQLIATASSDVGPTPYELGRTGEEIEQTTLTLLDLDQNVDATAGRMHLHRNTVRYRVNRFRGLTGLDLRRTDDRVTAWWLLKWRQARLAREGEAGAAAR